MQARYQPVLVRGFLGLSRTHKQERREAADENEVAPLYKLES